MPRFSTTTFALATLGLLWFPASALAQWPPAKLENVKALDDTLSVRQVINTMAGFTRALGVRCTYCHVGEEGQPLSSYDFPADDKETKEKARVMIRMLKHINGEHLAELPGDAAERLAVQCETCHRGQPRPIMLEDALIEVINSHGVDSAVAHYRGLRQRFFGRATYDFGETRLNTLGYQLLRGGQPEDALAIFQLNAEMYPESANVYDSLGDAHKALGHPAAALRQYRAAFELNPRMRGLQARIDSLEGQLGN